MSKRRTAKLVPGKSLDHAERVRRVEDKRDYLQALVSEEEFIGIEIPNREWVVEGLVVEESITVVNGYRGCGKSWLTMSLANEASWGGSVGPWTCPEPVDVLVVDGEMPLRLLQERMLMLNAGRDMKRKEGRLYLYPEAYAYRIGLKRADILDKGWRECTGEWVVKNGVKLMFLDNLASLAPGIDENEKLAFDPVNRWLLELRFHGVAIVMVHHLGKGGEQRGTSAHEDHVDTALKLSTSAVDSRDGGCRFTLSATKDRAFILQGRKYGMELVKRGERMEFRYTLSVDQAAKAEELLRINPWLTEKEAEEKGVSARTYYRAKKKLKKEGIVT